MTGHDNGADSDPGVTPQDRAPELHPRSGSRIERATAGAYTIPTDQPEADGTSAWDSTTLVVVQVEADGVMGTGWTYGAAEIASLVEHTLAPILVGHAVCDTLGAWQSMAAALRNIGRRGLGAMALSALDNAQWDLKARLLDLPLSQLLGALRDSVPVYGSGGFTTYDEGQLTAQLGTWRAAGMTAVKIKIGESWGSRQARDLDRVEQTLRVVGPDVDVFVDANGGYTVGQAVRVGHLLDALGVTWFEEPVSSDDLDGLRTVRRATRLDIAAGEYIDTLDAAQRLCRAHAVDCLQVDVTRCGGVTELLRIAAVAAAHHLQISGHCSPYQHAPVLAAVPNLRHLEYFHDHARIERMLFDGAPAVHEGLMPLQPGPGSGTTFAPDRAAPFAVRAARSQAHQDDRIRRLDTVSLDPWAGAARGGHAPFVPGRYVRWMVDSDAGRGRPDPDVVIVMGVSGSVKSTVAKGLSTVLGWEFAEGDAFHPEANVVKMRSGTPLTDEDRWPWLEAIGAWISGKESRGESAVVTFSALRRVYRDLLRQGRPHVRFLHVTAESEVIRDRMEHRPGHYMPASLLPSQLATLEPLEDDEPGVTITNEGSAAQVLDRALAALGHRKEHA